MKDKKENEQNTARRKVIIKTIILGILALLCLVFLIFSIYRDFKIKNKNLTDTIMPALTGLTLTASSSNDMLAFLCPGNIGNYVLYTGPGTEEYVNGQYYKIVESDESEVISTFDSSNNTLTLIKPLNFSWSSIAFTLTAFDFTLEFNTTKNDWDNFSTNLSLQCLGSFDLIVRDGVLFVNYITDREEFFTFYSCNITYYNLNEGTIGSTLSFDPITDSDSLASLDLIVIKNTKSIKFESVDDYPVSGNTYSEGHEQGYNAAKSYYDTYRNDYDDGFPEGGFPWPDFTGKSAEYLNGYQHGFYDYVSIYVREKYAEGFVAGRKKGDEEGYNSGYTDGYNTGQDEGRKIGYTEGQEAGYNSGYSDGLNRGQSESITNPVTLALKSAQDFLDIRFFGTISFGSVFLVVLFVAVATIFIKMFAGG